MNNPPPPPAPHGRPPPRLFLSERVKSPPLQLNPSGNNRALFSTLFTLQYDSATALNGIKYCMIYSHETPVFILTIYSIFLGLLL